MDYAEMVSQIMAAEQGAKVLAEESRARRQQPQAGQAPRGEQVGRHHAGPVADLVHKAGGDQIHQQLQAEVPRHQQGDLLQADRKGLLEDHKQQGGQVVDNGLGDVAQIAGVLGVAVIGAYRLRGTSSSKIRNLLYYSRERPAGIAGFSQKTLKFFQKKKAPARAFFR